MNKTSHERFVLVRNQNSSRAQDSLAAAETARDKGHDFVDFYTPSANPQVTTDAIAEFIRPGDFVYSAAGDGTANQVGNAISQAGLRRETLLAFGSYGNFNDGARGFGGLTLERALTGNYDVDELRPLDTYINGERQPSTMFYTTLGWTAMVAETFMNRNREQLKDSRSKTVRSLAEAARLYATDGRYKLPAFDRDGVPSSRARSDLTFRNGPIMARLVRGRDYTADGQFGYRELTVANPFANVPYLTKSIVGKTPDEPVESVTIDFDGESPRAVHFMQDGESRLVPDLAQFKVAKNRSSSPIRVARTGRKRN